MPIRKRYIDTAAGQIHVRELNAEGMESHPPLLCLHPAPYSGDYFATVMPLLNAGRRVTAPDYPGYGNSYRLDDPPSIADYAGAILESVIATEASDKVDLVGFHSGCLVAAELSLIAPERVRRLLLIDIPYFDTDTQQKLYGQVVTPLGLTHDLDGLAKAWDFNVATRKDVVPLERAFDMFVDQLGSGTRDHFCFHAAFTYDCVNRFEAIAVPTTVVATRSPLTEPTRAAARAIDGATLVEIDSIETSVFEQGADVIAATIRDVLNDG